MVGRRVIEIHGPFGETQAKHVSVKIDIALGIAGNGSDMMDAAKFHAWETNSFSYGSSRMYLWRRLASRDWWHDNEQRLRALARDQLAIIERPNQKRLQLEIASTSRTKLRFLAQEFGGRIEKLPRDWLKRSLGRKTKPLQIGNRKLIIPAGAAFGTGEHVTTAMCLRLLEEISRKWKTDWSIVDVGTGTGVLALAAKCLGAKYAIGIDNDAIAISSAKENARLNIIRGVEFQVADVRDWKFPRDVDVITANLFSELLLEIMPTFKAGRWLILSGMLRAQEPNVGRALNRNKIDIIEVRRRGKWVAILARRR
jgi:ribosomal protein L11 methyltransferase